MRPLSSLLRSSSFKLTLFFSGLLASAIIVMAAIIFIISSAALLRETESAIDADILMFEQSIQQIGVEHVIEIIELQSDNYKGQHFFSLRDEQGNIIAGNFEHWPVPGIGEVEKIGDELIKVEILFDQADFGEDYAAFMKNHWNQLFEDHWDILAKTTQLSKGYEVFVGREIEEQESIRWLAPRLGSAVILIMIFIFIVQFWVSIRFIKRIETVSETAAEIMEHRNLAARIPVEGKSGDFDRLSMTLNRMLDEIESHVDEVKRVTDNIAHDLRTPLTRIRTGLEAVEDPTLREKLLRESDSLLSMFNGLLKIAAVESRQLQSDFTEIRLTEIVEDVIQLYQPLIDQKSIQLETSLKDAKIRGHRDLLFQAIVNVIDNAVKFTPQSGKISVRIEKYPDAIHLVFTDSGPGIPEAIKDKVFQRFYRAETSRHTPGHGLGLSMVQAIIHAHGGTIVLESNTPGLTLRISLPDWS